MKVKNLSFKNFLLSKKSNFISYAISSLHLTYDKNIKNENFNIISTIIKKITFLFDNNKSN